MRSRTTVALAVTVMVAAGCSSPEGQTGRDSSVVEDFQSVAQLAAASSLIVRGQVVGEPQLDKADEDDVLGQRVPVFNVRVERSVKGSAKASSVVRVRTLGQADMADHPTLEPGSTYLLYLSDFMWHPGEPTGQYVIVGQQGVWEMTGDKGRRVGQMGSLPVDVTETKLVEESS